MSRQKRGRTQGQLPARPEASKGPASWRLTGATHEAEKPGSRLQATRQEGLSAQGWAVLSSTQAPSRLHEVRHCGEALRFTQSADLMWASSRNTFPDTPGGMLGQIPGQLMPRQVDT